MGQALARLCGAWLLRYPRALLSFLLRAVRSQLSNEYLVGMVLMAGVTPLTAALGSAASELSSRAVQVRPTLLSLSLSVLSVSLSLSLLRAE